MQQLINWRLIEKLWRQDVHKAGAMPCRPFQSLAHWPQDMVATVVNPQFVMLNQSSDWHKLLILPSGMLVAPMTQSWQSGMRLWVADCTQVEWVTLDTNQSCEQGQCWTLTTPLHFTYQQPLVSRYQQKRYVFFSVLGKMALKIGDNQHEEILLDDLEGGHFHQDNRDQVTLTLEDEGESLPIIARVGRNAGFILPLTLLLIILTSLVLLHEQQALLAQARVLNVVEASN